MIHSSVNSHPIYIVQLLIGLIAFVTVTAQEIPVQLQQQLENLTGNTEEETEDDNYLQMLERYSRRPLNINEADEEVLNALGMLSEFQILNLIRHRQILGNLISVYELQAVPGWDLQTIRNLLPFITTNSSAEVRASFPKRFQDGTHTVLLRTSRILENQKGFGRSDAGVKYNGSPYKIFARYRYSYRNLLQFGWVGDKDAGEQFFRGPQVVGFDFNSFHLFARKLGRIESLALGDYLVNLGQGLIQWQGLAFGKSAEATAVKRQSSVLRAYNSAGEYNFHRGAGITMRHKRFEWTGFVSSKKLSANTNEDSTGKYVSSIIRSGYHRTTSEIEDRYVLKQLALGGNIRYKCHGVQLGINLIHHSFSLPLRKEEQLYNLFSIKGRSWTNFSTDYSFTLKNTHLFGELAFDQHLHRALLTGCLVSADPAVDIAIVYRNIDRQYQAINANAFTENSSVSNEKGIYVGLSIRPAFNWKINLYFDYYQFPWLKYLIDAPSFGKEILFQLTHTPSKNVELQARLNRSLRMQEAPRNAPIDFLWPVDKTGLQLILDYAFSKSFRFRSRTQMVWLGIQDENGFSLSLDGQYKPSARSYSVSARLQFFETSGYNSRLYIFENDVLYSHSIPAVFGNGLRYYLLTQIKIAKKITFGFRLAQTMYRGQEEIGSGLDLIHGNRKTELKTQIVFSLN